MIGQMETRRIATSYLTPQEPPDYVETGVEKVLAELAFGPNLILKGAKGVGKTLCIEVYAARNGIPLLRYPCTDETGVRDLLGTAGLENGANGANTYFQLGALPAAVEVANDEGACILVLEEINTLSPQVQKILNPMTDYRQAVELPKIGKVFRVEPGKRIWILGTMNPNYTGTYSLNEDLRSRFQFIEMAYMARDQEKEVLLKQFQTQPTATERELVSSLITLAHETRSGQLGYALSTRDLVDVIRILDKVKPLARALKLLEGKFDPDKVADIRARVQSTFKVNLNDVKLYG